MQRGPDDEIGPDSDVSTFLADVVNAGGLHLACFLRHEPMIRFLVSSFAPSKLSAAVETWPMRLADEFLEAEGASNAVLDKMRGFKPDEASAEASAEPGS